MEDGKRIDIHIYKELSGVKFSEDEMSGDELSGNMSQGAKLLLYMEFSLIFTLILHFITFYSIHFNGEQ